MDLQYLAYLRQERNQIVTNMQTLDKFQRLTLETFLIAYDSMFQKFTENEDLLNFMERVQDVRTAQSKYFASRTQTNLDASKTLERKIDKEIKETLIKAKRKVFVEVKQASMFDENERAQRV